MFDRQNRKPFEDTGKPTWARRDSVRYLGVLAALVIFGASLIQAAPALAFSMNMVPPSIRVSVKPGTSYHGQITLENDGDGAMPVAVTVEDWIYSQDGGKTFLPTGSTPRSCAKWVSVEKKSVVLEPKIPTLVGFSVDLPKKASGGYFAVIFFKSGMGEGTYNGEAVTFSGRMGSILYIDTAGRTTPKGHLADFHAVPTGQRMLEVEFTFVNDGNTYLSGDGQIVVQKVGAKEPAELVRVEAINTLPGDVLKRKVVSKTALEKGVYEVSLSADLKRIPAVHDRTIVKVD